MDRQWNKTVNAINDTIIKNSNRSGRGPMKNVDAISTELSVTLYSVIFVLSVSGNVLVLLTLIREKKMRTITNMFLLNLAVSDMLLSVLCMPFSLVATVLLRNFVFGEAMCIIIRYFQAVSVGVSCYTLVVISLERYYAICQPLRSRKWQTLSHARRMIVGIWIAVMVMMCPIAIFHRLIRLRTGANACREIWPEVLVRNSLDKVYSGFLATVLLILPLILMSGFYGLMGKTLWITSRTETYTSNSHKKKKTSRCSDTSSIRASFTANGDQAHSVMLNSSHHAQNIANRKRVIRMLFVIVLQYFICWAPIYILNTWQSIDFRAVFRYVTPTAKSLILLLAYTSSFIHPITYCFMNRNFRQCFMTLFGCKTETQRQLILTCSNVN